MQTTVQKPEAIRKGSVKVQIGDDFATLVDIGAIRTPKLTSKAETQTITFDNAPEIKQFSDGDKVEFSFVLTEINLTNLSKFDGGLVTLQNVAGTPVVVSAESVTVAADTITRLANKNGDGTRVASLTVTGKVEGTDYEVFVDQNGYTCLTKIGTGSFTANAGYTYTPNASKKLTFNNSGTKTLKALRVINTDANGKVFQVDIKDCTNINAPAIDFASDKAADVATLPITLEGYFVSVTDEQQIS